MLGMSYKGPCREYIQREAEGDRSGEEPDDEGTAILERAPAAGYGTKK